MKMRSRQPKPRRIRSLAKAREESKDQLRPLGSGPLRIVAFSDYRVQDIELFIEELRKLRPAPDLVLYAGDDIRRFRPPDGTNLFEVIASHATHGLCAVAGNDDEPSVRKLISGKSVFNVYSKPIILGNYAVAGIEGAPMRRDLPGTGYILHTESEISAHLKRQKLQARRRKLIILSHAPPEGTLDRAQRFSIDGEPRSIGSRALKTFLHRNNRADLVVCGHVHRCGGKHKKAGRSLVVNAANHDNEGAVGRFAVIDLGMSGTRKVGWQEIKETSVVPGIGPATAARLRQIGIRTVEELSAVNVDVLRRVRYLGHSPEVLKARAQAMKEGRAILLKPLPPRTGPDIFLDIETDLLQKYIWLIGVCDGRSGKYKCFFASRPEEEKDILVQFLMFANRRKNATYLTLSGCNFEHRVISERLASHRLNAGACARIVDLYWPLQYTVVLPTTSYRVKDVGTFFGYRYKHPDLDGYQVASLYERQYLFLKTEKSRQVLARKLLEYNEDDVRCLPHILNAIQALSPQAS